MTKFKIKKFDERKKDFLNPKIKKRINFGNTSLRVLLFALILFAGISYLYYINQTATGGFDIKGIENQIEQVRKDNKQLEVKTAELQSLVKIEEANEEMKMVATTSIEYLPAVGSAVAVR